MRYKILKDFPGSQDGRFTEQFRQGTVVELSAYLVSCIPAAWIEAVGDDHVSAVNEPAVKTRKARQS